MTVVAIHQPNFFPWLGYFDKMRRADVFVFLDDVQYQKTGGTWTNRVRVLAQGEGRWLTAPIVRSFHGTRLVNEIEFSQQTNWRQAMLDKLQACYAKAAAFREAMGLLTPIIEHGESNLAEYNIKAITSLCEFIEIDSGRFVRSSAIPTSSAATERLIEITRYVGATDYLCGAGAAGYQQDDLFAAAGITLRKQNFIHPPYPQPTKAGFVPGLSIIDVLMHCGRDSTAALLRHQPASDVFMVGA